MGLKTKELRNESHEELTLKLSELRNEIYQLRSEKLDNKTKKTHLIGTKRKDIARILTCLNESTRNKAGSKKK